jgi:D-alanyl-D-alanine dipeptidase
MIKNLTLMVVTLVLSSCVETHKGMPKGFVHLSHIDPTIQISLRYAGEDNFLGRPVNGYTAIEDMIMTIETAHALKRVQEELLSNGYSLLIYDAYRPQMAVDNFMAWSKDVDDQKMKEHFYPYIDKRDVFMLGYVAEKSGHSRGSTVDLTLIPSDLKAKKPVYLKRKLPDGKLIPFIDDGSIDMGASFDLFDEVSHTNSTNITVIAQRNRTYLKEIMERHGFKNYEYGWWHFTLENEPFPSTYFNFPVK